MVLKVVRCCILILYHKVCVARYYYYQYIYILYCIVLWYYCNNIHQVV